MSDLVYATARELAEIMRRRKASASEVLEEHLAQIKQHNRAINAIVTIDEKAARQRAREADDTLARGDMWGPLHGVPVTIKDSFETAGMRTTSGFPPLADYVPTVDATVVARLRAAGAIILGKTNMPALTAGAFSDNPISGHTNNPWDLNRSPGGSSGGSAAAVATGMIPLDIGSDVGGSLRNPASFCGVCSLKPTELLVSTAGHIAAPLGTPRGFRHQLAVGPVARSADDLALALHVIAGPDVRDWDTLPVSLCPVSDIATDDLRVAWTDDLGAIPVISDTSQALAELAGELQRLGWRVEREIPDGLDVMAILEIHGELFQAEVNSVMSPEDEKELALEYAQRGYTLDAEDPLARGMARGFNESLRQYAELLVKRDALIGAMEQFFGQWDALLCPVVSCPALPHPSVNKPLTQDVWYHRPTNRPMVVEGHKVEYWVALSGFTAPFNLTGNPAVVLPLTRSKEGLPIGIQVIGRRWGDMRLLAVASRLSEVIGPFQKPPGF